MNHCILTGNLGGDPESFFSSEGAQVVSFGMAFRSTRDKTNWVKVVCFNKMAEVAEKYLHKGARIAVHGILDQNKWEAEDGKTKSVLRVIANSIEFIKTDGRGFENREKAENPDDVPF